MAGWFRKYLPGGTQNPNNATLQPSQPQQFTTGEFRFSDEEIMDFYSQKAGMNLSQQQIDYIKANTMNGYYVKATETPERSNSFMDLYEETKTQTIYD